MGDEAELSRAYSGRGEVVSVGTTSKSEPSSLNVVPVPETSCVTNAAQNCQAELVSRVATVPRWFFSNTLVPHEDGEQRIIIVRIANLLSVRLFIRHREGVQRMNRY